MWNISLFLFIHFMLFGFLQWFGSSFFSWVALNIAYGVEQLGRWKKEGSNFTHGCMFGWYAIKASITYVCTCYSVKREEKETQEKQTVFQTYFRFIHWLRNHIGKCLSINLSNTPLKPSSELFNFYLNSQLIRYMKGKLHSSIQAI